VVPSVLRRLLTDAAPALALLLVTVGPGLVTGPLTGKPGEPQDFVRDAGIPVDPLWWLLGVLIIIGVTVRRQRPGMAMILTAAGTCGHLVIQTKFQLLDLALPLVLYSLAAAARRRRVAVAALGVVMLLAYGAMLAGRLRADQQEVKRAIDDKGVEKVVHMPAPSWADGLADTSQSVLEMWLLLVAAYAVGDGVRSRRAHLAAVEQRTADLAREERQRAALAVAAERTRITRELHDVVAHGMSVMVVQAQGAAAALEQFPEESAAALRNVIDVGRSSLDEMRRLLAAEREGPDDGARLEPLPGIGAVPTLVDQLRSTGMRIDLHIDGLPEVVPAAVDLSAYRIVQEALTNTLKHAGPDAGARVRLEFDPRCLRVEVSDDGAGPPAGADGHGSGLRGIAERVAMLGGVLETGRGHGGGFRLGATLPVRP
jgi:signal transduction histidine kinase